MDLSRFTKLVARNLRIARHRKGLTLEAATKGRGEYRYLWELEKAARNPTLEKLFMLAKRYGVTVADLVSVPGAEHGVDLSKEEPDAPKRGRKPSRKTKAKTKRG